MQLNHIHLSVSDVAASTAFFVKHCHFTLMETRGHHGLAVLKGQRDVTLVLMRLSGSEDAAKAYPPMFHIGLLIPDEARVAAAHAAMKADALEVSELEFSRGGQRFYCKAPSGLLVEVGHQPDA